MDGELLRPLYIPWASSLWGIDGYLHWAFNAYQPGQNPFETSCVVNFRGFGQTLPAGDTHIVYPGPNGPWGSVRLAATCRGAEDFELLAVLHQRHPSAAESLVKRLIRDFDDYTTDVRQYHFVRRDLLELLERELTEKGGIAE